MAGSKQPATSYLGVGLAIGVAIGSGVGIVFGNLPIGIALGLVLGIAVGAALDARQKKASAGGQKRDGDGGTPFVADGGGRSGTGRDDSDGGDGGDGGGD